MNGQNSSGYNLRPLWDAILEVYAAFEGICKRHNLRYCADCGTALGAVRHHGFIPWDDDFDLQMPRPDYEKFVSVVDAELPSEYKWLDRFNCALYEHGFGKVIVSDKKIVERVAHESGLPLRQGIFIDVFPLDGYPDSVCGRIWRKISSRLLEFLPACEKLKRMLGLVRNAEQSKIRVHRKMVDIMEARAKKYQFGHTQFCVSIGVSRWFDDKPFPCAYFGTPQVVHFDKTSVPVQENVDGYLKAIFGRYMQLPPLEKRHLGHEGHLCQPWRLGPV